MRKFTIIFTVLIALVLVGGVSFAQRGGGKGSGKPRPDSTHPSGPKLPGGPRGPYGLSDSCFKVFLSLIPADQATLLTEDMRQLGEINKQVLTLRGDLKKALKARDSAEVKRIMAALRDLITDAKALQKAIAEIVRANQATLLLVRKECMDFGKGPKDSIHRKDTIHKKDTTHRDDTTHHKGGPGDGGDPAKAQLKMAPVVPNPVLVGAPARFTYAIGANTAGTQTQVEITITDAMGNIVKNVFSGLVDAGEHNVELDLSGLTPGVYILRIQAGGAVASQKIMIQ